MNISSNSRNSMPIENYDGDSSPIIVDGFFSSSKTLEKKLSPLLPSVQQSLWEENTSTGGSGDDFSPGSRLDPEISRILTKASPTRHSLNPLAGERTSHMRYLSDGVYSGGGSQGSRIIPDIFQRSDQPWYLSFMGVSAMSIFMVLTVLTFLLCGVHSRRDEATFTANVDKASGGIAYRYDTLPPGFNVNLLPLGGMPPGRYTKKGYGTWHILPVPHGIPVKIGSASGKVYTFVVGIEDGITDASIIADENAVAELVDSVYSSPYGWTSSRAQKKVRLVRVGKGQVTPDFQVLLTTPETTKKLCGFTIPIESSCYLDSNTPGHNMAVLNLARYLLGAKTYGGDTMSYREYEINHETGHALGYGHEPCAKSGKLAPVMMEQTFSLANRDIFKLDKSGIIPNNSAVCKPNPWPYPPHK